MKTLTEVTARENTDIEFVCEGRLYQLEITKEVYGQLSAITRSYYGDFNTFKTDMGARLSLIKHLRLNDGS